MADPAAEPQHVLDARQVLRDWRLRNGHESYTDCLDGGYRGYQAACWDCDWRGTAYLRGNEDPGTEQSRAHKRNARREAEGHRRDTLPEAEATPPAREAEKPCETCEGLPADAPCCNDPSCGGSGRTETKP